MFKNTAQKLTVFAFADAGHASLDAGEPVTGDAANITCKVEQDDDGTRTAVADTNPTETEDGQYVFEVTAAECNGDKLTWYPESATAGVQVVAWPSSVIYTRPANFPDLAINVSGHVERVVLTDTTTTNTDMRGTDSAFLAASAPANFSLLGINGSGHVSRVTTVDTTTANTDMRGTDSALLAANVPSNFSALGINASGHVSRVTTVDTTTANTDMRGTDSALLASSAPTNWSIMVINGSGEITTSNPASGGGSAHTAEDVRDLILAGDKTPITMATNKVSGVVTVDTTTANTDMRGTDGANTTAPDNASIALILEDSNELQTKMIPMLEDDGASGYQFTALALENAPSGGGGGGDSAETIYTYFTDASREDAFKADVSNLANVKGVTDKLDTALEDDGASGYQFTTLAMENVSATVSGQVTVGAFASAALNQLAAIKVYLTSPYSQTTRTLTLVKGADYTATSLIGPVQFEVATAGAADGDAVVFRARDDAQNTIEQTGAIADVSGTLYAQIPLAASATQNLDASPDWTFNLFHVNGSGEESPLLAGQSMVVIDDVS